MSSKNRTTARGNQGAKPKARPAGKPRYEKSRFRSVTDLIGRIVFVLFLVSLVLLIIGFNKVYKVYLEVRDDITQIVEQGIPESSEPTYIYARDCNIQNGSGTELGRLYRENRQKVTFDELSPDLIACFLSTEDKRFLEHKGIDFVGTFRAILMGRGRISDIRGASTISQQLARNVFLPSIRSQKTIERKLQEYIIAMALEKRYTKEEILETYLNHIYLGARSYGVKVAANKYFDKSLAELTLAECALLAGLPQSPSAYNPYDYPQAATSRRDAVLNLLATRVDTEFFTLLAEKVPEKFADYQLDQQAITRAIDTPVTLSNSANEGSAFFEAEYFTSFVSENLYDRYSRDYVNQKGLQVVTTLNPQYQRWAEEIVKEKIDEKREAKRVSQAAVIVLEAATGEVLVCVGGYEWHSETGKGPDETNRALIEDRPVGSSFKPFTYATAYEQGLDPYTTIWDGPNEFYTEKYGKDWPLNSDHTYLGWISTSFGLQMSRNAASVDLLVNFTGVESVIETARKMGITADLPPVASLTLGVADIKPLEMAEAFATFANMGTHVDSILVKRIYNHNGILREHYDNGSDVQARSNQALSRRTAWMMVKNMQLVVQAGTGTRAQLNNIRLTPDKRSSIHVAGKTGTNDDFADAWFVGYTPELVCAVWVGNDDYGNQMRSVYGGHLPAEIFDAIMTKIYSCQLPEVVEGEEAPADLTPIYLSPYQQTRFERPPGVSFGGFQEPIRGAKLIQDEEGNWVPENPEPDEEEVEEPDEGDPNHEFYERFEPEEVYF